MAPGSRLLMTGSKSLSETSHHCLDMLAVALNEGSTCLLPRKLLCQSALLGLLARLDVLHVVLIGGDAMVVEDGLRLFRSVSQGTVDYRMINPDAYIGTGIGEAIEHFSCLGRRRPREVRCDGPNGRHGSRLRHNGVHISPSI